MRKAYDRIEWDFLQDCLLCMGFDTHWVTCIMSCVRSVSYGIKFNVQAGSFKGIQLNRHCPKLSHLLFADDSIFFLDGTLSDCQCLNQILNQYCYASGQAINLNKSGIYFSSGCPQSLRNTLAAELRVPELKKTGQYLGLPSDWGQTKRQLFSWILARVHRKLEGWKEKLFSMGGKEILIKAVVQAIPQYAMTVFKVPISVCRAIERRVAAFWWNSSDTRGLHWRNWDILKQHKQEGGLGFRDLRDFNMAMLGKTAWRLHEQPSSLWATIFKGLYFPRANFWEAKKGARPSWGWQSVLAGRDSIAPFVRWQVGNGERINVRSHSWLPSGSIGGQKQPEEPLMVAGLITPSFQWDVPLLRACFTPQIVQHILAIPLTPLIPEDRLVWAPATSGQYSVKTAYRQQQVPSTQFKVRVPSAPPIVHLLWQIWKARNGLVFRQRHPDPWHVVNIALANHLNFTRWNANISPAQHKQQQNGNTESRPLRWQPPPPGTPKLNVDGSFISGQATGVIAGILRDSRGRCIDGFAQSVQAADSEQVEAFACQKAIRFAVDRLTHNDVDLRTALTVVIESDCRNVIEDLTSLQQWLLSHHFAQPSSIPQQSSSWSSTPILLDCCCELDRAAHMFSFCFCPREANKTADWLCQAQRRNELPSDWPTSLPVVLSALLCSEAHPTCTFGTSFS
ncbi:uncharacterized protein LOC125312956 [Rhodamnia argentea]|uniref:Uncharacterized protein LOC125312956 n=1 Tax=Rhodamnia argentea TaxID=178133 RepID=A0ABM3GXI4_9MYRT|nr:uncharacterized protein LOC125312956 [Rhodamnia argentea]